MACARVFAFVCLSLAGGATGLAQFKEIGPPPVSPAVAHEQIRTLVQSVDSGNSGPTVAKLNSLAIWYRNLIDDELVVAWQGSARANLLQVIEPMADPQVAARIIDFSWRQQREATFIPDYAPMLGRLMARYPESAKPFLDDLLGPAVNGRQMPDLSPLEAAAVCRILVDMPDSGTWKKDALQILPHYRDAAERILREDVRGSDQEKSYTAQRWLSELNLRAYAAPEATRFAKGEANAQATTATPPQALPTAPRNQNTGTANRLVSVNGTLRRLSEKDLLLQMSSGKVLRFRLIRNTEFRGEDGKPVRDSLLRPGDRLTISVSPDDVETATQVVFIGSPNASEREAASAPVDDKTVTTPDPDNFRILPEANGPGSAGGRSAGGNPLARPASTAPGQQIVTICRGGALYAEAPRTSQATGSGRLVGNAEIGDRGILIQRGSQASKIQFEVSGRKFTGWLSNATFCQDGDH